MDFILRYIDLFLNKGVDFLVVLQTFMLSLGHMFALIIPMAVLPATLMTFGNLASENEITAMKASGISLYRMLLPGVILGSLLTVGMILYNNHVLPESNHRLLNLLIDINKKKPTVEIKENVFINAFRGWTIYVRHKDDKTGDIREIQMFRHDKPGALPTTIIAEKGKLQFLEREHVLRFELENGEIHEMPEGNDPSTYRRTEFKNYEINIADMDRSLKRTERHYRGDREMNVKMMRDRIAEIFDDIDDVNAKMTNLATAQTTAVFRLLDPATRDSLFADQADRTDAAVASHGRDGGTPATRMQVRGGRPAARAGAKWARASVTFKALESQKEIKASYFRQINRYRVEIHKKFSIPFACVIFILIGSPIAVRLGRSGMNMAIGLSILVFLVYYICLIGGEKLADRAIVSPVIAMWVPNLFFGIASLFLIRMASLEQSAVQWSRFHPRNLLRSAK
jgi:lipopolysaccharide export system permease protein